MAHKIIRSWEALWQMARRAGCTHWNYSRGKLRFRTATRQPYPVGQETPIDAGPPVRVRFYVRTDGAFAERGPPSVQFRPPSEPLTAPSDFTEWPAKQRDTYISGLIDMLSAPRFAKHTSPADRVLLRTVAALQMQIATQARKIAELEKRLSSTREPLPNPSLNSPSPPAPSSMPLLAPSPPIPDGAMALIQLIAGMLGSKTR